MNRGLQLLDASLRDGGHRTNFHFQDNELKEILSALDHSKIEYIEVGYRSGSLHPIADIGRAGLCDEKYLRFCHSFIKKAKMTVMAHPHNITQTDLDELKECGVRLIRICVSKGELAAALPLIQAIKNIGLEVSINFIHLSYYNDTELDKVVEETSSYHPQIIYFADSNGSILPSRISDVYERYTHQYPTIDFGFHAHDNLGLAQANAIAAMDAGARFIDVSLAGMGKGTGNLKTEFFTAYLQAIKSKKYNLEKILYAANYVRDVLKIGHEAIEMDEFIRGISDLSTADLKAYKERM